MNTAEFVLESHCLLLLFTSDFHESQFFLHLLKLPERLGLKIKFKRSLQGLVFFDLPIITEITLKFLICLAHKLQEGNSDVRHL